MAYSPNKKKRPSSLRRDVKAVKSDFTHHFGYTMLIVAVATILSYIFIYQRFQAQISLAISNTQLSANRSQVHSDEKAAYEEESHPPLDPATEKQVILHGSRDSKKIALTFDAEMTDGMKADLVSGRVKSSYDSRIIDTLIKTNTPATLFLTGLWIELYPKETEQFASNSLFELGSHSYTDSSYSGYCYGLKQLSSTLKIEDIGATEKLLREHGHIDNQLFRFPGGCYTADDVKLVNNAGDIVVHWDVSAGDGFNDNIQSIVNSVVNNTQNGSIIIMHLNGSPNAPRTADALPTIISILKKKGFEFVKISQLLNLPVEPKIY